MLFCQHVEKQMLLTLIYMLSICPLHVYNAVHYHIGLIFEINTNYVGL